MIAIIAALYHQIDASTHSPFPFCLWITSICYDRCCYQDEVFIPCKDCCSYVFNRNDNDKYAVEAAYCCHVGYWSNTLQCPELLDAVKDSTDPIIQSWFTSDARTNSSSSSGSSDSSTTTNSTSSSSGSSSGTTASSGSTTNVAYNFYNVFIDNVVTNTAAEVATSAASVVTSD